MRAWAGLLAAGLMVMSSAACAQQHVPDRTDQPPPEVPAYAEAGQLILFDEAHGSGQTIEGQYAGFAALAEADGYRVESGTQRFNEPGALDDIDILVISNPALVVGGPNPSAYSVTEIRAIEAWVRGGGALLLAANQYPHNVSAQELGRAFGVRMGGGIAFRLLPDETASSQLMFSDDTHTLGQHPILAGRGGDEVIRAVQSSTGQSITGPEGSTVLLALLSADRQAGNWAALGTINERLAAGEDPDLVLSELSRPALTAQGVAFEYGEGRVVVLGDAGMLSVQGLALPQGSSQPDPVSGPQAAHRDDAQFTLNIFHWLSRLI